MKISIQMLSIDSIEFFFLFNHRHHPVIEVQNIQYASLALLLHTYPFLSQSLHLEKLAQMANFLAKGLEFQYIENIESFREKYYQQIETEQSNLLDEGVTLKDFGIFDLSAMKPPYLENQNLLFFVRHDYSGIPYRASLLFPLENLPCLNYELLPLIS